MRIGFVGAGLMGAPMVRSLAGAGHDVRLFARSRAAAVGLPATLVGSVAEAASGADALCSSVTDSADVVEVVEAALASAEPPPLLVELSTIAPAVAVMLGEQAAAVGASYLDCPVSGGPQGAEAGSLAIMCGGDPAALERATPILDAIGDPARRFHCGPVGAGLVVKLVNNLLVGTITAATAEALGVAQAAGVDPALARDVVLTATGSSWQLDNLFPKVLAGDHRPGFKTKDLRKDLAHAQGLSDRPLPLGDVAAGLYRGIDDDLNYGAVAERFLTPGGGSDGS